MKRQSKALTWQIALRFLLAEALLLAILFISAGTLEWLMAWLYLLLTVGITAVSRLNRRYGWPPEIPPALQAAGLAVLVFGVVACAIAWCRAYGRRRSGIPKDSSGFPQVSSLDTLPT